MAEGVKIEIVSPEVLVLSAQARSVIVPGSEGYLTVMGDHAPLMAVLKPGFVTVTDTSGAVSSFFVGGGFADISDAGVTILAEEAKPASEFGRTEIEARITAAQQALAAASDIEDKSDAQNTLDTWKNLLLESATLGGTVH
ncbi:F0F1 ATP synthase subunit epsilon [Pelagibacterium halotolerans]|uniref:ATP synthase epsilon chain n=1 Tax=Pelagibacterium halotolerans (strain DSM 22347 / JCM 15775 / CGMCC 1.7692 / B2) TaxID=1082931 RepID=G4R6A0_PELHB|nr:F0F1 ATP synthase subunit epsilon [Pelagibacterium halotolerans]AEQ53165.1 ATP synthase epsilon chain [Pelagibacterium halotolerans B2]QJR17194.1 F0F1 ATP synthase subunit epsilon [Pelagibacterium halotolerans]SEA89357.1 ATP synthase F1 subcomplex epsilon subunit [Pelagibacterium halotolerans]